MSDQLIEDGAVVTVNEQEFECTSVSYQETDGKRHSYSYNFRLKSEVDAEREAASGDQPELSEELNQPEQPEEETQHVR